MAASEDDMAGANPLEARPTDEIKANLDHPDVVRVLGPDAVALLKHLLEAKNDMAYAEVAKPMAYTHTKAAAAAEISAPAIKLSTEEKGNIDLLNTEKEGLREELRDFFSIDPLSADGQLARLRSCHHPKAGPILEEIEEYLNEKLALADALERALNDEVAWAKGKTFKEATDEIQKWRSSFGGKIAYGIDSRGRALTARAVTEEPYRAEEKLMHNRLLNIFEQEAFGDELIGKEPQEVEGNIIRVVDPNLPRDGWNSANRIVEILNYGVRKLGSSTPQERTKVRCGGYEQGLHH